MSHYTFVDEMAENVRIYLRIRPSRAEDSAIISRNSTTNPNSNLTCLMVDPQNPHQAVTLFNGPKAEIFTYDCVGGPETEQEGIFESVAKPVTEYCLQGYNGTIFAYGQTGSGKTYTMQGPMTEAGLIDFNQRGLIPRTFEYLFECIRAEEEAAAAATDGAGREFLCKCSYVEIYNETIFDLLDSSGTAGTCNLREDIKKGVYIEGAKEEIINSPTEAYEVYERGSLNRHVAETSMNRESSRSHSVFTLFIQSKQRVGEIMDVRESRFNLVDLAGSERQQMTGTTGQRLKEAGNINKSLLALSNVINGLVDISNGKARHVQYRDSKLTFLLRDSLGGNAKTVIIANVSPTFLFYNETLSTLKFAQRAKMIKNKAVVNKDIQGNVLQLQAEIQRLQHELYLSRHNQMDGIVCSNETVNSIMMASSKKPRLISSEDDELDPAEAYLMLTMALERQAESSDQIESFKTKLNLLEEFVKRKESQNQSLRMILKFRENSIKSKPAEDEPNLIVLDLKDEINELRKIIEHHPEVTRFAYENLQLREKLYKFEVNEKKMEEFESILDRHKQYEQLLTNRLLVLEKSKDAKIVDERERDSEEIEGIDDCRDNSMNPADSTDSVNMQIINTTSETTRKYEDLMETISLLEKDLETEKENRTELLNEIELLNENIKRNDEQNSSILVGHENTLASLNNTIASYENTIAGLNCTIADLTNTINSRDNSISVHEVTINQLNCTVSGLNELEKTSKDTIDGLNDTISALNCSILDLENKNQELLQSKKELDDILNLERSSLNSLIQERDGLKLKSEQIQRQNEREKEQSKLLLQDYEKVKVEFNVKINEQTLELASIREELTNAGQKVKGSQLEKGLLQQELEVTRQILAEYKSRDQNASASQIESAEKVGKRISELENEILSLNEQIAQLSTVATNVTSLTDRNKILQAENGQLHGKIGKLEFLMKSAQGDNDELMGQLTQLQKHLETSLTGKSSSNDALQNQLEVANHTITSLKGQLNQFEVDLSALRDENDKLTQHQNLKQKLQYHLKIKQENNELQEELTKCREELLLVKGKQDSYVNILNEIKTAINAKGSLDKVIAMIKTLSL